MLENLFTTKMSMDKKKLQNRFTKIRSKNGQISKLIALIIFAAILIVMVCATIIIAVNVNPNGYYMTGNEFFDYINRPLGAVMANIDYADDNKIVFHYGEGFFIYNLQNEEIDHSINLKRLDISYNEQGSSILEIKIDKAGKYAYLSTVGPADEIKNYDKYIINLKNGEVKKGVMPENTELFAGTADTFTTIQNPIGWYSNNCIISEEKIYYLTSEIGTVNGMQLVTNNKFNDELEHKYIFGNDYVSKTSQVKAFSPADIKDITDVELVAGGIKYPLATTNAHTEIEKAFSSAIKIEMGGTACPFDASLIFTRADGGKCYVTIATDSCAVFKSGDTYYDYGEDNSMLLGYFGLDINTIHDLTHYNDKLFADSSEMALRNFFAAFYKSDLAAMKTAATNEFLAKGYIGDYGMCYGMTRATLEDYSKINNHELLDFYFAKPEHTQFTLSENDIELLNENSDRMEVYSITVTAEHNIKGVIQPPYENKFYVICKKELDKGYLIHKFVN